MLPLLLSPSPTVPLHVANALSSINPSTSELTAQAQLQALSYAVRWEIGIGSSDFLGSTLEGDRWLVWAAGNVSLSSLFVRERIAHKVSVRGASISPLACTCCSTERSEIGQTTGCTLVFICSQQVGKMRYCKSYTTHRLHKK